MLKLKKITPAELTPNVLEQIIELIKTKFIIDDDVAAEIVKDKHIIHLYIDNKNDKLIGVIGFRCDFHNDNVYLYVGASVIDDTYQKCGILSKSIMGEVLKTYLKYPLKHKYALAFCTTPEAYQYFYFLDQFWPNRFGETPAEIVRIEEEYAEFTGIDNYTIKNGAIISHKLRGKIQGINPSQKINRKVSEYFNELIGQDHVGDQVLCITHINRNSFITLFKRRVKKFFSRIAKNMHVDKLFVSGK